MLRISFKVNRDEPIDVPVEQVQGLRDRMLAREAEAARAVGVALDSVLSDPTVAGVRFEADEMSEILGTIEFYMGKEDWAQDAIVELRHALRDAHDRAGGWTGVTLAALVADER